MMFKDYASVSSVVGTNIRKIRKSLDLSYSDVARILQLQGIDISPDSIRRLEAGHRVPTVFDLLVLSNVLSTSWNQLLKGVDLFESSAN